MINKKTEKFIQKIPGWLEIQEGRFLEKATYVTESLKGEIVEIGSFCGKSTIYLAQSRSSVYAVDPHKGNVGDNQKYPSTRKQFLLNLKTAQVQDNVIPLIKTSTSAAQKWKKPIRTLFIDGLHDEKNAEMDFVLWSKHLVDNGIIAIHDSFCHWCGSEKVAVNNIIRSKEYYKVGFVGSIIFGIKGKGTFFQKAIKFLLGNYIILRIQINHFIIIGKNLSLVRNKFISTSIA